MVACRNHVGILVFKDKKARLRTVETRPNKLRKEGTATGLCFALHSAICLALALASALAYSRGTSLPSYALRIGRTSGGL